MDAETVDTLVIGAGQAGLAMSCCLSQAGCAHLVVERARVGERWRAERWDSLAFQFPNWSVGLPGMSLVGASPQGFAGRDEVVGFLEAYATAISAPVRTGVAVRRLARGPRGFVAETGAGAIRAAQVVVATGPYQRPVIPAAARGLDGVAQVHARDYRNPGLLPAGAVLVVGSGASGCQIAEDLVRAGRTVWLSVGSHRRAPRRYRGFDFQHWEAVLGEWDRPAAERPAGEPPPLLTGVAGGRDMDIRELAEMGVRLLGRLTGAEAGAARFAPDLAQTLARGDGLYARYLAQIDAHAAALGLDLPPPDPAPRRPDPPAPPAELDLAREGIGCVIWATGYGLDLGWIEAPGALSAEGAPIHADGIGAVDGLYFLGLPWLSKRKSTLLAGVGEDAERLAAHIAGHAEAA